MPRRSTPPKYCAHTSGQARVRIGGAVHYLGPHGSPESYRRYAALIADWHTRQSDAPSGLTVGQLTLLYLQHAQTYYVKDGEPTGHLHIVRNGLKYLNGLFRTLPVGEFDAKKLTVLRNDLITRGFARKYINDLVAVVKRMFRWAVPEKLAPVTVHQELTTVGTLKVGRTAAREPAPIRPVPVACIDAIERHVPAAVWAMIQLQRLTGMRPGEVLILRGCDLNTTGDVWEYSPSRHKLEHKGIARVVMIGPAAQVVLRPFLRTDTQAYLFSAEPDGSRPNRRDSYANAIKRGCEIAFGMPTELRNIARTIARQKDLAETGRQELRRKLASDAAEWRRANCWHPNQLRHTFATMARRAAGIEAARVTLGHSSAVTSEIYAERDLDAARAVVARIG